MEEDDGKPVVYTYELDPATQGYAPSGVHRDELVVKEPFALEFGLDLSGL